LPLTVQVLSVASNYSIMGNFAHLIFEDYVIASSENDVDPNILSMFQEDDLQVEIIRQEGDIVIEAKAYFENTLGNIVERLNIIGYPKDLTQGFYTDHLEFDIKKLKDRLSILDNEEELQIKIEKDIQLLEDAFISDFNDAIAILIDEKVYIHNKETYNGTNEYCRYLLEGKTSIFDNYPDNSIENIILGISDSYSDSSIIRYDYSNLIDYSYFEITAYEAFQNAKIQINYGHKLGDKIIILTEGSTDIKIFQASMALLYPYLKDYYYFMDFHSSNASGSTSSLVNTIKSFIGAGLRNKVVALFDNDTAARESLTALKSVKIPKTISIQHLPYLHFAENYPTIGPTGLTNMNINKMACSIEMYLGDNFLKDENGYIPVQWKGYSVKMRDYQGEVLKKESIQDKFFRYLEEVREDITKFHRDDFTNLELIFEQIFNAFNPIELAGEDDY
jgi:hypothetical protein